MWTAALWLSLAWASAQEGDAPPPVSGTSAPLPGTPAPGSPHYDLELIYAEHRYDEGLELARARMEANPSDPDIYVHVVRFMFEVAERFSRTDTTIDKKAWYSQMTEIAEKGLELRPDDPHLLFAYGVAKGRLGTTRGVLSSLFMAKSIEEAWLATVASGYRYSSLDANEVLPCDAHLTLGIFYRLVPDWWIVKTLAGTRGDLNKSLSHLLQADACAPGRAGVVKELGVTQLCIGDKREDPGMTAQGKATIERMIALPIDTPSDEIDQRHGHMLLEDPSLACEYSRDGQQDLDEDKLATQ